MMSKPKRLHPLSVIFQFVFAIRQSIFGIIAGYFALKNISIIYFLGFGLFILLLTIVFSVLGWFRFTYRIENEELRIEHGIFIRKKRYISKNRIQSIDLTANVFHRLFGLVKVEIQTAGSSAEAEASLDALSRAEGEYLRKELKANVIKPEEAVGEETDSSLPSLHVPFSRLFIAGSTSGSIGVFGAIAALLFSKIEQFIPNQLYEDTFALIISLSIIILIGLGILILFLLWLLGIAGTMIKYGNFTIRKSSDDLFISRGLLEKKQLTIPLSRIQAVGVKQNIVREMFGYATLFCVVAGGSLEKGEDFPVLIPIIKKNEIPTFLQQFLPEYYSDNIPFTPVPTRSVYFYLFRSVVIPILLLIGVAVFFLSYIYIPIVILVISIVFGWLRYKNAGYWIDEQRLFVRYRVYSKVSMIMYKKRIQSITCNQHKIQAINRVASMTISTIGSGGSGTHYTIKDLSEKDCNRMLDWFSRRK